MESRDSKLFKKVSPALKKKNFFPWKIFLWETFLFSLTLGLGIIVAFRLNRFQGIQRISLPPISLGQVIFYFILGTLFTLAFISFKKFKRKGRILLKAFFVLSVFFGGLISVTFLLPEFWISDIFALVLAGILIFIWLKKPSVFLHDLLMVFSISGIAGALGVNFDPWMVVTLLVIFSIYDFIAVYKTKHMVKMARELTKMGIISALIIPQQFSDFKRPLKEVRPGGKFLILGGGDIAFPLFLCASLVSQGILKSFIIALFATFGLVLSFYFFISQKTRKPIPALPPIAFCSIIGFLITRLF